MLKRVPIIAKAYQITFVSCREIGEKTYVATWGVGEKHDFAEKYTPLQYIHVCGAIYRKFTFSENEFNKFWRRKWMKIKTKKVEFLIWWKIRISSYYPIAIYVHISKVSCIIKASCTFFMKFNQKFFYFHLILEVCSTHDMIFNDKWNLV